MLTSNNKKKRQSSTSDSERNAKVIGAFTTHIHQKSSNLNLIKR